MAFPIAVPTKPLLDVDAARQRPTLLVDVDPALGLTERMVVACRQFAG